MEDRVIKVVIPTDEEIERLKECGIDIEACLIQVFANELYHTLHPEDSDKVM